jgi:hypothetical protein
MFAFISKTAASLASVCFGHPWAGCLAVTKRAQLFRKDMALLGQQDVSS